MDNNLKKNSNVKKNSRDNYKFEQYYKNNIKNRKNNTNNKQKKSNGKKKLVSEETIIVPKPLVDTKEIEQFLKYCDLLDDDLFVEVCESFSDEELDNLQKQLDTENYRNTISVFTTRVKEIAHNKLAEIINEADAEIKRQEQIISNAHLVIEEIHREI